MLCTSHLMMLKTNNSPVFVTNTRIFGTKEKPNPRKCKGAPCACNLLFALEKLAVSFAAGKLSDSVGVLLEHVLHCFFWGG